jgi:hypothetical protein
MIRKLAILTFLFAILLSGCGGGGGGDGSSSNDGTPPDGGSPPDDGGTPPPPSEATLTFSPGMGSYQKGESFTVDIFMNTGGEDVVAAAAYIQYDRASFRATGIDTTGSVFPIKAEEVLDAANGIIKITRGMIAPGVNTANGKVATIHLTAISSVSPQADNVFFLYTPGSAKQSNVIRHDGLGTPILSVIQNARFSVP